MANAMGGNPKVIDTVGTTSEITKEQVRLIQWVDDNGDLVHDSNLIMTINGNAIEATIQPLADQLGFGAVAWQIGPFNPGIMMTMTVDTMTAGKVYVWTS